MIRRSEIHPESAAHDEPPAGSIRNVLIKNVIAHGNGPSVISGHPDSCLEGITMKDIKLFVSSDPTAPYEKEGHAIKFQHARHLKLENIEVAIADPESTHWLGAIQFEDVKGLDFTGFKERSTGANG